MKFAVPELRAAFSGQLNRSCHPIPLAKYGACSDGGDWHRHALHHWIAARLASPFAVGGRQRHPRTSGLLACFSIIVLVVSRSLPNALAMTLSLCLVRMPIMLFGL